MDITREPEKIRDLLKTARTIAVVGASPNPERDSHAVARYLLDAGYRMIPVNPGQAEILGQKAYPDLRSIAGSVDIVDIFRRPEHTPPIVEDAIAIKAKAVWFQLETAHPAAVKRAEEAGLLVVRDA
ncbi:MAG: CoA-binding protein [Planctomycetes bacterium]|nr:CoA-binding protein [Planctomycetota bacterium]